MKVSHYSGYIGWKIFNSIGKFYRIIKINFRNPFLKCTQTSLNHFTKYCYKVIYIRVNAVNVSIITKYQSTPPLARLWQPLID